MAVKKFFCIKKNKALLYIVPGEWWGMFAFVNTVGTVGFVQLSEGSVATGSTERKPTVVVEGKRVLVQGGM